MYKTIIIPIDLSHLEKVDKMLNVASLLREENSKLVLLHVVEDVPAYVAAQLPKDVTETSLKNARKELEKIAAGHANIDVEVRSGQPHFQILGAADEREADLIVIASHKPGLKDFFLGSTAARVVRHALCPVHVIR